MTNHLNIEIKARCHDPEKVRQYLLANRAQFKGVDIQTDTYFNVSCGRLKLRQGNIENNLIYYERDDSRGPKESNFQLLTVQDAEGLKAVLTKSIGVKIVVEKKREIYFIGNVKFHIDHLGPIGNFVEIEASNLFADLNKTQLKQLCDHYCKELQIESSDLVKVSYSDMLMEQPAPGL